MERRTASLGPREALALLALAIVVRLAFALVLDTPGNVGRGLWEWGYEAACIGDSLARGAGYANTWTHDAAPWDLGSGPTAWLTPVYPGLIALLLELTHGLTRTTAWLLFAIQAVVSALTCLMTAGLGARLGAPRAGRLAAWVLCLHPLSVWHASQTVWDTTLAAWAFTALLSRLAAVERAPGPRDWTWLGLLFGFCLLVNAAPLAAVPVVLWVAWRARPRLEDWGGAVAPFALAAFAVTLPWLARNASEVGAFTLRTNLGVELHVGNHAGADGHYARDLHPSHAPAEFLRYRAMGEVEYARWARTQALEWIADHPGEFVRLTLHRIQIWWVGEPPWSDLREDRGRRAADDPASWLKWGLHALVGLLGLFGAALWAGARSTPRPYLLVLVLVPPAYCVTHVLERYRWPIEPVLVLCAAWLVERAWSRLRRGRAPSAATGAGAGARPPGA